MDILSGSGCLLARRATGKGPAEPAPARRAGGSRLFLAFAVIAAFVGLLEHASGNWDGCPAVASVQDRKGTPQ